MKSKEADACVAYLGGQFPARLTTANGKLLMRQFLNFEQPIVMRAIDWFKLNHEFRSGEFEMKPLIEAIRNEERKARQGGSESTQKEGTWFDVWRRLRPQLAGRGDVEVCLRVHRQWLIEGGENYREKFLASCRNTLYVAGMQKAEDRQRYAETILLDPDSFRQALEDVRDCQPSLMGATQ